MTDIESESGAAVVQYPKLCDLCGKQIESQQDLDWHGYGNCVDITDEMWATWERESK